ncbi:MAG TPA: homoserine dehydrogenase [Acidimicrobiales bacterium]|nr:homoserine dehydrogenase [Acidimicrobiales bacterium]
MASLRVGLLGCGNVGGALVHLLVDDAARIAARTGLDLSLTAVAVRSQSREREVPIPAGVLTTDAASVVADPDVDVVVEVIGGIEPARTLILTALKSGKPVITANKELLANCGAELFEAAASAGVDLLFEAAVAGGIPLIRPLRESLAGESIRRVMGIVNGTTNFILTRMSEQGASYHDALAEAQSLGYAERDPTADVEGFDAAAKAAILANVAFGARVVAGDVYREGIAGITESDIAMAHRLGYIVKLLAVVEHTPAQESSPSSSESVAVRVHPAMVPSTHPLASVRDSFNAVFVQGAAVGDLMFLGRGAGGMPTASAVLGDLLDAAHNLSSGGAGRTVTLRHTAIRPIDDLRSAYYIALEVADRPGVLHAVSGVLGQHQVSIRLMEQESLAEHPGSTGTGSSAGAGLPGVPAGASAASGALGVGSPSGPTAAAVPPGRARLVFVTHPAYERDVQACLGELRHLDVVHSIGGLLRVIGS